MRAALLLLSGLLISSFNSFVLPTLAHAQAVRREDICSIPITMLRNREVVPGAARLQALEKRARDAWSGVDLGASMNRPDSVKQNWPSYISLRAQFDRQLGPLIEAVPVSDAGFRQFVEIDSVIGPFARCLEAQAGRSVVADHLRRKAEELAPMTRKLWEGALRDARTPQEFQAMVKGFGWSQFLNEAPSAAGIAATGIARRDGTGEALRAARRAEIARREDAANQLAEDRRRRAEREVAQSAANIRAQATEVSDARQRARRAGLPISAFAVTGVRLGSVMSSDEIRQAMVGALNCGSFSFVLKEEGSGGDRVLRGGCTLLGQQIPGLGSTLTLRNHRVVRIRQDMKRGNYSDNCWTVEQERKANSFATHAASLERAGYRLFQRKSIDGGRNVLGLDPISYRWHIYRAGNVTVHLWENRAADVRLPRCQHPDFRDYGVSIAYTFDPSTSSPES